MGARSCTAPEARFASAERRLATLDVKYSYVAHYFGTVFRRKTAKERLKTRFGAK